MPSFSFTCANIKRGGVKVEAASHKHCVGVIDQTRIVVFRFDLSVNASDLMAFMSVEWFYELVLY